MTFTELEAELRGPQADPIRQALRTYITGLEQELHRHASTRLRPRDYEKCAAAVEAVAAAKTILDPARDAHPATCPHEPRTSEMRNME